MKVFLNVILLVIGAAATLAAFGGETWTEGAAPIVKRITLRGWVSLVCLVLALVLGTTKEFMARNEEIQQAAINQKIKDEAGKREEALKSQVEDARKQLEDLRLLNRSISDHLSETQITLGNVRQNLNVTRDQLTQATTSTLLGTIGNSELKLKSVRLFLPFTAKAQDSVTFAGAFLPSFDLDVCKDLVGVSVYVVTQASYGETFHYVLSDKTSEHKSQDKADWIFETKGNAAKPFKIGVMEMKQSSWNGHVYIAEAAAHNAAGELLTRLTGTNEAVAQISLQWPSDVPKKTWKELTRRYRSLFSPPTNRENDTWGSDIKSVPKACSDEVGRYFKVAFEKATISLLIAQRHNLEISFVLKALPPFIFQDRWRVTFIPETHIPQVLVTGPDSSLLQDSR